MSDGNVYAVTLKLSRTAKDDLLRASSEAGLSVSEYARGILLVYLAERRTHTPLDAVSRLEADVKLIKEKLGKAEGGNIR